MSTSDNWNPTVQYPDGTPIPTRDKAVGTGMVFTDTANILRTVSNANPLPVSINGVTINVSATGLATQLTLAAVLAALTGGISITAMPTVSADVISLPTYALRFDSSASPILYLGQAAAGSADGAASWQIQQINTSVISIKFAGGSTAFTSIWNNRAALVYS